MDLETIALSNRFLTVEFFAKAIGGQIAAALEGIRWSLMVPGGALRIDIDERPAVLVFDTIVGPDGLRVQQGPVPKSTL
jgi:hypothetical protein